MSLRNIPAKLAGSWERFGRKRAWTFTEVIKDLDAGKTISRSLRVKLFEPLLHTLSFAALVFTLLFQAGSNISLSTILLIVGSSALIPLGVGYLRFFTPGRAYAFKSGLVPTFINQDLRSFKAARKEHWSWPSDADAEHLAVNDSLIAASLVYDELVRSYHAWVNSLSSSDQDELRNLINKDFKLRPRASAYEEQVFDTLMGPMGQFMAQSELLKELKETLDENLKARQDKQQASNREMVRVTNLELDAKREELEAMEDFPPLPTSLGVETLKSQVSNLGDITTARTAARDDLSKLLDLPIENS